MRESQRKKAMRAKRLKMSIQTERADRLHKTAAAAFAAVCTVALLLCACTNQTKVPSMVSAAPSAAAASIAAPPSVSATNAPSPEPVPSSSPTPAESKSAVDHAEAVCVKAADVYAQPSAAAAVTGRLKAGDTVDILANQNGWMQITAGGLIGYAQSENMITKRVPAVPVPQGDWAKILVNPSHLLPAGFTVSLADFAGGQVDERILAICQNMFADAQKDGAPLLLVDAYRSRERQSELYEQKVQSYLAKGYSRSDAEREAATITARPDTSEHQTGLALDIVTPAYTSRDSGFANTRAFYWLNTNAANYGFTLRYGKDKETYTKVIYEPWHWRFVGVADAKAMKESGQCLEEYLGQLN